jgi:hypothetical protein
MSDDEGMDVEASVAKFMQTFGPDAASMQERVADTQRRLQAEKRAGMTPKQRAKRAKKTETLNCRCSPEIRAIADALAAKLDCGISEMLEKAVLALAEKQKLQVPK